MWFRVDYSTAGRAVAAQASAPSVLPLRVPRAQGPPFPVPRWDSYVPGRIAIGPEILERVRVALTRL